MESLALYAAVREARARVVGGTIRNVAQPEAAALQLEIRRGTERHWLLLRGDRAAPALCVVPRRLPRVRPTAFGAQADRWLARGRLEAIEQAGLDRIVTLRVARREPPDLVRLVCQVIPARGNLLLVDGAHERVVHALHPVPPTGGRPLGPGLGYVPPPRSGRPCLVAVIDRERFVPTLLPHLPPGGDPGQALRRAFDGLTPLAAAEVVHRAGVGPDWPPERAAHALWRAVRHLLEEVAAPGARPVVAGGPGGPVVWPIPLAHRHPAGQRTYPTLGEAILAWLPALEAARQALARRRRAEQAIRRTLDRLETRARKLQADLAGAEAADGDQRAGELLLARKAEVPPGASAADLPDFEAGRTVRVTLDPSVSVIANAERYFRRARKARRGRAVMEARLGETWRLRAALAELGRALEGEALPLEEVERQLGRLGALPATAGAAGPPGRASPAGRARARAPGQAKLRRFVSSDGLPILVGRDERSNDQLSLRLARAHDLWLHARDAGGSHVVVRLGSRQAAVPPGTLREAAQLAAYYSQARGRAKVEVAYTRAKHLRKPKGARPGLVHIGQERTILVRADPGLVQRLAAHREGLEISIEGPTPIR